MNTLEKLPDGRIQISLDGELTLPHAADMKSLFVKALIDADVVTVKFGEVQDADLSLLQLLCSAHRSAVRLKKQVQFEGAFPKVFQEAARAGGFTRLKGCKLDTEKSCLWTTVAGADNGPEQRNA